MNLCSLCILFLPDHLASGMISDTETVIIGGGHAAVTAVRAARKGLVKALAIFVVAPTWAGPLPIVFGQGSDMESR